MSARDAAAAGPWQAELAVVVRAASGGLLFGVPLLYTMEVWWTGSHTHPSQMLLVLGLLSLPVFALNRTTGFRMSRDVRTRDALADTAEAMAVGVVVTTIVLVLLQEITPDTSLRSALGKVVYEAVPFCLGIGVARHFLHGGRAAPDEGDGQGRSRDSSDVLHPTLSDLGATVLGAAFISLSIAPTDEVPMVAAAMSPLWLLALVAVTLVTSYAIVFAAEFHGQEKRHRQEGPFQWPITETVVSYLVSLGVAALLLWLFQRGTHPPDDLLARTVVLGLPAAIGGAAGRLAV